MEYNVEDISPVKKKINIQVPVEEVNAALAGAVAILKNDLEMPGFRKGKVPTAIIEKQYGNSLEKEARDNLINVHINDIVQKLELSPVSPIVMHGEDKPLKKGEGFEYSMEFEVMPSFDLPSYEGLETEQKKWQPNDKVVDELIERYRKAIATLTPADGNDPGQDGQIANIDFETILDGEVQKDFGAKNFNLELGAEEALPDFEALVRTIPPGHTGEGDVTFPEDFLAPALAGKTAKMRVTVNAVKNLQLPVIDDEFARKVNFTDLAHMRRTLEDACQSGSNRFHRNEAQNALLEQLVKQIDFPLPEAMVKTEADLLLHDYIERMQRMGKNPLHGVDSLVKLQENIQPQAENRTRQKILLLAIAKKENLSVSPQELHNALYEASQKMGADFREYVEKMESSGLIFQFRDNMLCDKALDLVYERAKITPVEVDEEGPGFLDLE